MWIFILEILVYSMINNSHYILLVQRMQEYLTLPVRKEYRLKRAQPRRFMTNFIQIRCKPEKSIIYQYSVDFEPELPNDSTHKMHKIIKNVQSQLNQRIGFIASRGGIIYGTKNENSPIIIKSKMVVHDTETTYQLLIRQNNYLKLQDMMNSSNENQRVAAMQALNINTKERLKAIGMVDVGKGKFYKKAKLQDQVFNEGFFVLKGYKFTCTCLNAGLFLHVDIFSRVIRKANLLQEINCYPNKNEAEHELKGQIVIARYGNYRTYEIIQIDTSKSPQTKFTPHNKQQQITYEDYYKSQYDVIVRDNTQPLILSASHIEKRINKQQKTEKIYHYIYLIPELLSLAGLSEKQRNNNSLMKKVADKTKLSCEDRMNEIIKRYNKLDAKTQGIYNCLRPVEVEGYVLESPHIQMGKKQVIQPTDARIKIEKYGVKEKAQFRDWFLFYFKDHEEQARELQKSLRFSANALGVGVNQPVFIDVDSIHANNWIQEINEEIQYSKQKNYPLPNIIMIVVGGIIKDQVYNQVKAHCTLQLKIPTQFVHVKKIIGLSKKNNLLSYATNLILQMNQKLGSTIWSVQKCHPDFRNRKLMVGGFSVSKVNKKSSLAFVGSTDRGLTKIYNQTKIGVHQGNMQATLMQVLENWVKTFYINNKKQFVPDTIIIYREGISKSQLSKTLTKQLECLKKLKQIIRKKTPFKNAEPELIYVLVNKFSNTRFFQGNFANRKFANPPPGGVIVDTLSQTNFFEFHLTPHLVQKSITSTPTHFTVCYHENRRISKQALIQLTYQQCYNYYNWKGAIKFPACLQNADRLAKMSIKTLKQDIQPTKTQEMCQQYHFL